MISATIEGIRYELDGSTMKIVDVEAEADGHANPVYDSRNYGTPEKAKIAYDTTVGAATKIAGKPWSRVSASRNYAGGLGTEVV